MDAYDIALLMVNQDPSRPLKMRYGTVADNTGSLLQVVPDGQTETTPVVKCCHPLKGDRVILLVNGTEWLAISVIGGESAPPRVGQPFITAASEDPSHCLAGYQMAQAGRQVHPSVRNAFPRNNRRRSRPYVKFG